MDYVTKEDLKSAMEDLKTDLKTELKTSLEKTMRSALEGAVETLITEMGIRFGEVNRRLDRIEATSVSYGKQLAAGGRSIAGLNEWIGKADADYARVLAELADLKMRVAKLESAA